MPAGDSSNAFRELAAQAAGEKWLGLLDRGEYAKAWEECAQLFRQRVTREQWVELVAVDAGTLWCNEVAQGRSRWLQDIFAWRTGWPICDRSLSNEF